MNTVAIIIIALLAIALCAAIAVCFVMRSSAESKGFDRGLTQGRREMESEAAERERKAQARYDEAEKRIRDAEQKRAAADELIENAAREAEVDMAPQNYTAGSWGPSSAIALIERDGASWHD